MGGTVVFYGTRVPAQTMFDYLIAGDTLDEFLRDFPSVLGTQAKAALALAMGTCNLRLCLCLQALTRLFDLPPNSRR